MTESRSLACILSVALLLTAGAAASAGEADVLEVEVSCDAERICSLDVTVQHADEGWEHYANRWEVLFPDGEILATRVLAHPHVDEQPFTRSLDEVEIPSDLDEVVIRAHDSVHEYGGREITVELP
jgi:hypothetical protein